MTTTQPTPSWAEQIRAALPDHAAWHHGLLSDTRATWTTPRGIWTITRSPLGTVELTGPGLRLSRATTEEILGILRVLGAIQPAPVAEQGITWRDYTLEPDGESPGVTALCRSNPDCYDNQPNQDGRYLTLGEAVDWAQKHAADHARWAAEIAAEDAGEHPAPSWPIRQTTPTDAEAQQTVFRRDADKAYPAAYVPHDPLSDHEARQRIAAVTDEPVELNVTPAAIAAALTAQEAPSA